MNGSQWGGSGAGTGFQGFLDPSGGLADAVLVLHEGEADVAVAGPAEADAGGDGDLRLPEQVLGELQRSHRTERLGDWGPGEHPRRGDGGLPPPAGRARD